MLLDVQHGSRIFFRRPLVALHAGATDLHGGSGSQQLLLCPAWSRVKHDSGSVGDAVSRICRHGCAECQATGVCLVEQEGGVD